MVEQEKDLYSKFADEVLETDWELLKPHHSRKALFVVEPHLDLVQMAIDVATDNVPAVKNAMELNLLRYPSSSEVEKWELAPNNKIGRFLIVSPYVFIQENRELQ